MKFRSSNIHLIISNNINMYDDFSTPDGDIENDPNEFANQ